MEKPAGKGSQATKKAPITKQAPKAKAKAAAKKSDGNIMSMVMNMLKDPSKKGTLEQLVNKAAATKPSGPAAASGIGNAKMLLSQWVQTKTGEQATKDQIVYTTTEVEGSKPPEFVSEVVILPVDPSKTYKGKKAASKKAAEALAAEAALRQNGQGAAVKSGSLPAAAKPKKAKAPKEGKECKWCAQGECWTHGQIEKPAKA